MISVFDLMSFSRRIFPFNFGRLAPLNRKCLSLLLRICDHLHESEVGNFLKIQEARYLLQVVIYSYLFSVRPEGKDKQFLVKNSQLYKPQALCILDTVHLLYIQSHLIFENFLKKKSVYIYKRKQKEIKKGSRVVRSPQHRQKTRFLPLLPPTLPPLI